MLKTLIEQDYENWNI